MMKKTLMMLVWMVLLSVPAVVQADPIQDNSLNGYKAGWYPNFYKQKGPLICPETCKIWVSGVAEQEKSMAANSKVTSVCKFSDKVELTRAAGFLYGDQFDGTPVCYVPDMNGKVRKSEKYYCLCIADKPTGCQDPDLIVAEIQKPVWDNANKRSVIKAVIKNIGVGAAGASIARLIDPSTTQPTGAPYNAIANTPALAAGASATVTFYLPYWVYNPDAELEVTADYKGVIKECDENNNTKTFKDLG